MKNYAGRSLAGRNGAQRETKPAKTSSPHSRPADDRCALLGAMAITILATGLAEAATVPDGYVTLGSGMGVASARVLADGSLELTLVDGSVRICAAGDFVVLEGGGIAVSGAIAAELTAVSGAGVVAGLAAGLIGAAGAAAAGGTEAESAVRATVSGDVSGEVVEDDAATLQVSGALTVTDPNAGEAVFVAQKTTTGTNTFGSFTLDTDGAWSYAANNAQVAFQSLGVGETLTDSFTAVTADGATQVC